MSIFGGSMTLRRRPLRGSRRTHKRRHSMHGGSLMHGGSFPSAYGGSRRRSRSHRGRGIWDTIKNGISSVAPHVLNGLKDIGVSLLKSKLGLGRRRRRAHSMRALPIPRRSHHSMIGRSRFNRSVFSASIIPMIRSAGRRRRHSRRRSHSRRGGHLIGFSRRRRTRGSRRHRRTRRRTRGSRRTRRRTRGSRRHRRTRRRTRGSRRHRRVRRGRGILGNLLGSILPF